VETKFEYVARVHKVAVRVTFDKECVVCKYRNICPMPKYNVIPNFGDFGCYHYIKGEE
jgi:hypothetical protein